MVKGDVMVTLAEAVWALPSVAVALTVQVPGAKGAVYKPAIEIAPQLAVQVAGLLATNCCVACSFRLMFTGVAEKVVDARIVSEAKVLYGVRLAAAASIAQMLPLATDAVNTPPELMLPQEAVQITGTSANCCLRPCAAVAFAGVIITGEVIIAIVAAVLPLPSAVTAEMVQEPGAKGAVYRPAFMSMLPQVAVQVATTSDVNRCVAPSLKVGLRGEIVCASRLGTPAENR